MEAFLVPAFRVAVLVSVALAAMPANAADVAAGATVFKQRCTMCHVVEAGAPASLAPNLFGIVGRPAASTSFAYSDALKKSKIVWSTATLDQFLTAPGKMVPGTRMVFNVPDAEQRGNVVAYLATLKKK